MSVDALETKTFSRFVVPREVIYSEALDDLLEKFCTVLLVSSGWEVDWWLVQSGQGERAADGNQTIISYRGL